MRIPADLAILSDLDGTLIESTASTVAAYRWWAELRAPSLDFGIEVGRQIRSGVSRSVARTGSGR